MNKKLNEIIKIILFGTDKEIQRIPLEYNVTLEELKELNNYFLIQDSIALNNAIMLDEEKLYKNSDVSTILFNNYIIEVLEDLNNMLSDVK